jgi:hypothetical protein
VVDTVDLGSRAVNRVGISTGELRATGMWGEPSSRNTAIAIIRRAVEMGADIVEVPVPFGPAADLFREAQVHNAYLVARLTERLPDFDAVVGRLGGRRPDLVLAEEHYLDEMRGWPVPLGAIVGPDSQRARFEPLRCVRGPWPALRRMVDWCEEHALPYMAPSTEILGAGRLTIALPAVKSIREVERLFAPPAETPNPDDRTDGRTDDRTDDRAGPATPPAAELG